MRAHLFDLVHAANTTNRKQRRAVKQQVRPSVQRVLDAMTGSPAYVRNGRLDILAANRLGTALFSPIFADQARPTNIARFMFLNPGASEFYVDWERLAGDSVALLRAEAGRNPYDKALSDLIGELSTRSETFRTRWAAHNVRFHRTGVKHLHHPDVGDLTLTYEVMAGHRPDAQRIQCRAWLPVPGRAEPPRHLGGNTRPGRDNTHSRPDVSCDRPRSSDTATTGEDTMEILGKQPTVKGPEYGSPPAPVPPGTRTPSGRCSTSPRDAGSPSPEGARSSNCSRVTRSTRLRASGTGTARLPTTS